MHSNKNINNIKIEITYVTEQTPFIYTEVILRQFSRFSKIYL